MKKKKSFEKFFVLCVAFVLKKRWGNCNGMKMVVENSGSSMEAEQASNMEEDNSTGTVFVLV